jgi:2-methylcitrate dehydratase PrpD
LLSLPRRLLVSRDWRAYLAGVCRSDESFAYNVGADEDVTQPQTATGAVVELVEALRSRPFPEAARQVVRFAFLDSFACILAGSQTQAGITLADYVAGQGGREDAAVIGRSVRVPAGEAALANGTAAHALDYDDIVRQLGHPSVVLVPALMAAGERARCSGASLVAAYAVGFEVMSRALRHLNPAHFARGWHATSTIGVLGATAAVGALMEADSMTLRNALGIAASSSAGLRKMYGSMVKPLHAGMAAHNAVVAVDLARSGFAADRDSLDGDYGFLSVYRGDSKPDTDFIELFSPERPLSLIESGLTFKRFACCGASHAAVDGVLRLRTKHPELADADQIESVVATVNRLAADILFHHEARTGDEGRFSMEYSLAAALLDGWLGVAQFSAERVADPKVQALSKRVHMVVDPDAVVNYANWPAEVVVTLKDGRRFETSVARPKGHPDDSLSLGDLMTKFVDCGGPAVGDTRTAVALELIVDLESVPDVMELGSALMAER